MTVLTNQEPASLKTLPSPNQHWLKGSVGQFEPIKFHQFMQEQANELGPIYQFRLFTKNIVVISEPSEVAQLLKKRPAPITRGASIDRVFKDMGIDGVFSAEGESWQRYRKLLNPAFRPSQIKQFFPLLKTITERLCQVIEKQNQPFDFQLLIQRFTVDVTSLLAFGYDINTLEKPNNELKKHLNRIFPMIDKRLKLPIPIWRWLKTQNDRQLEESLTFVQLQILKFIKAANARIDQLGIRNEENPATENMLQAMILSKDEEGNHFSNDELFGNVMTLLLAGEDTTANTTAWVIDYLCKDQTTQQALADSINQHYPKDKPLDYVDLDAFTLIDGAIQESLRLKPVGPFLFLESCEDEIVCNTLIPSKTTMVTLISSAQNDETLFKDASSFKPSRWQSMSEEQIKKIPKTLFPFGFGARICPGRQLALTEMKICLLEIIKRFEFSANNNGATEYFAFTMKPENLIISVKPR